MKYYKLEDIVYAYESDGSQDDYIKPDMVAMTKEEIDRHINPNKYLSAAEKQQIEMLMLPPLTRRQFKLLLLDEGLLDKVDEKIELIKDLNKKTRVIIEYNESVTFERTSPTVTILSEILGLTNKKLNVMWEKGSKL